LTFSKRLIFWVKSLNFKEIDLKKVKLKINRIFLGKKSIFDPEVNRLTFQVFLENELKIA